MQDHTLSVGEELVIEDLVRLTILAVEEGRVVFGIAAEPHAVRKEPPDLDNEAKGTMRNSLARMRDCLG